jgi:hypothetical protein
MYGGAPAEAMFETKTKPDSTALLICSSLVSAYFDSPLHFDIDRLNVKLADLCFELKVSLFAFAFAFTNVSSLMSDDKGVWESWFFLV